VAIVTLGRHAASRKIARRGAVRFLYSQGHLEEPPMTTKPIAITVVVTSNVAKRGWLLTNVLSAQRTTRSLHKTPRR
jgi:hypothetical protein